MDCDGLWAVSLAFERMLPGWISEQEEGAGGPSHAGKRSRDQSVNPTPVGSVKE